MLGHHLVRIGVLGQVGRFMTADAITYARGTRVIVRTPRGLETGDVLATPPLHNSLSPTHLLTPSSSIPDGTILRRMTIEDQLLEARLNKNRAAALAACERRLQESNLCVTLVDVEHLFDGRGLYFYFLGDVPPQVDALTAEMASLYDMEVQFRRFTETLTAGCGPDCGTEHASGGGCSTCATGCAIAGACGK